LLFVLVFRQRFPPLLVTTICSAPVVVRRCEERCVARFGSGSTHQRRRRSCMLWSPSRRRSEPTCRSILSYCRGCGVAEI